MQQGVQNDCEREETHVLCPATGWLEPGWWRRGLSTRCLACVLPARLTLGSILRHGLSGGGSARAALGSRLCKSLARRMVEVERQCADANPWQRGKQQSGWQARVSAGTAQPATTQPHLSGCRRVPACGGGLGEGADGGSCLTLLRRQVEHVEVGRRRSMSNQADVC